MRRILAIALGTAALGVATAASAADMGPVYKGPPPMAPVVAPHFNWSGFYIGGFVGGAWTDHVRTHDLNGYAGGAHWGHDNDGSFIGGGTIGFNWQAPGSSFVLGVEGEIGFLDAEGSSAIRSCDFAGANCHPRPPRADLVAHHHLGDWYGVLAGRAGFAWDRALVYVKGGAAFIDHETHIRDNCSAAGCSPARINAHGSHSDVTWALGGGVEWAFASNWTVKAEYLYLDTKDTHRACGRSAGLTPNRTFCFDTHTKGTHTAKLGINYLFNWGGAPVAARY
jgi:outer membrane immunogenic protein